MTTLTIPYATTEIPDNAAGIICMGTEPIECEVDCGNGCDLDLLPADETGRIVDLMRYGRIERLPGLSNWPDDWRTGHTICAGCGSVFSNRDFDEGRLPVRAKIDTTDPAFIDARDYFRWAHNGATGAPPHGIDTNAYRSSPADAAAVERKAGIADALWAFPTAQSTIAHWYPDAGLPSGCGRYIAATGMRSAPHAAGHPSHCVACENAAAATSMEGDRGPHDLTSNEPSGMQR